MDRKKHWENIYQTKILQEASWYQPVPKISLYFFKEYQLSKTAEIIDVGGGDSLLVDHLLFSGYANLTVVDISEAALERAKNRLGQQASRVNWIVADITELNLPKKYDFWHDRAAFHFLTAPQDIDNYLSTASQAVRQKGILVLGTFSKNGPNMCSGFEIKQYSPSSMTSLLSRHDFQRMECLNVDHQTPSGGTQNFTFCSFFNRR